MSEVMDPSSLRESVLLDLAKRDKTNATDMFRGVTEASARALGVARVGIWRLFADRTAMICDDLYLLTEKRHEHGRVVRATEYAECFRDVLTGRTVCSASRMDVPIWHRGSLYGVVAHEHEGPPRHWRQDELEFAGNLADVVALTLEASERQDLEHRWATVIGGIAELIVVLDRHGRVVQSNARSFALIDRVRDNALALEDRMQVLEYRDLDGNVIPHHEWPGPRALRGEHVREVIGAWHKESGFLGYYRAANTPIYDGDEITGCVCVISDVTEETQFERLKAEFLAKLGNEMKPPVEVVKQHARQLIGDPDLDPAWRAKLEAIERGSKRMERVIDDVVEISVLARGTVTLARDRVDVRSVLSEQVERIARTARAHRIHQTAPTTAELVVDRARIEKVLRRLLDNAIRYSPAGGDIDVDLAVEEESVVISIRDRGIGIPIDKQPHIFDMFFRAHARTAHDYGGLGLGLYISREIARLHGGDVWFESVEGQGSTFNLLLPREVRP
jgi:signal transduction histidine kinase